MKITKKKSGSLLDKVLPKKNLVKKDQIKINLKEITSQPVYTKDRSRFFNKEFENEKRRFLRR